MYRVQEVVNNAAVVTCNISASGSSDFHGACTSWVSNDSVISFIIEIKLQTWDFEEWKKGDILN